MAKHILQPGTQSWYAHCKNCDARFTYQLEDVSHNYMRGGEWFVCPCCKTDIRHFGASGTRWNNGGGCGR